MLQLHSTTLLTLRAFSRLLPPLPLKYAFHTVVHSCDFSWFVRAIRLIASRSFPLISYSVGWYVFPSETLIIDRSAGEPILLPLRLVVCVVPCRLFVRICFAFGMSPPPPSLSPRFRSPAPSRVRSRLIDSKLGVQSSRLDCTSSSTKLVKIVERPSLAAWPSHNYRPVSTRNPKLHTPLFSVRWP